MVDNKKIKLPQHLQLDSVSPATRLLEKRRLMYEVQKAFEDQKEDFRKKEEGYRLQEQELREKDILIQDNLIKFSTFLQQQETRRTKEIDLARAEELKIKDKTQEIMEAKKELDSLHVQAASIDAKMKKMKNFEEFLLQVQEQNSDEYQEISDIVGRYETLKSENEQLNKRHEQVEREIDRIQAEAKEFKNDKTKKKLEVGIKISANQQEFANLEGQRTALVAQTREKSSTMLNDTREHGQLLMTIDNLYNKCKDEAQLLVVIGQKDDMVKKIQSNYDNVQQSVKLADRQLDELKYFVQCFVKVRDDLKKKLDSPDIFKQFPDKKELIEKLRNFAKPQ